MRFQAGPDVGDILQLSTLLLHQAWRILLHSVCILYILCCSTLLDTVNIFPNQFFCLKISLFCGLPALLFVKILMTLGREYR